jgi:hypothetical protein
MVDIETLLAAGRYNYLPVVQPRTDQLIGILSSTDVLRARQRAHELLSKPVTLAVDEIRVVTNLARPQANERGN